MRTSTGRGRLSGPARFGADVLVQPVRPGGLAGDGLRRLGAALRAAAATAWAGTLLLTGLWIAMNGPTRWPVPRELCLVGGLSLLAGGQFLFLVLVADRVFPRASSRVVWAVEVVLFAAFVLGLGATLYLLGGGVGGAGLPSVAVGEAP
ncbi:MAG: hypothetical protein JNL50_05095 [Phycisphaerae bacterium]|nr:hypothetical protein [Phycisphaerae bacterium]